MASSDAAMLLNPRAHRKQLQNKNGKASPEPELEPASSSSHQDPTSSPDVADSPHDEEGPLSSLLFSTLHCPSSPSLNSNTLGPDTEDSSFPGSSTNQPDSSSTPASQRSPASSVAPPGTASAAHLLLNSPRRRQQRGGASRTNSLATSNMTSRSGTRTPSLAGDAVGASAQVHQAAPTIDVEFASASSDFESDDRTSTKRSSEHLDDDGPDARHGSLIENMYGVERRASQPIKRVKVEKDQEMKAGQTTNFSGTGNSELGGWMKEGRDQADSSSSTANVVDLTTGMGRLKLSWEPCVDRLTPCGRCISCSHRRRRDTGHWV